LPIYFVSLFSTFVDNNPDSTFAAFSGSSMWSWAVTLSTAMVALSSPILGVIADRVAIKKALLWIYTATGAGFTLLMAFGALAGSWEWAWMLGCFFIANVGFAGANVFYNAFLPHLGEEDLMDEISSRGFAYGYIGGGLLLAVHLGLIMASDGMGWDKGLVTELALGSVGVWWFGFALWTFKTVPEPPIANPVSGLTATSATALALRELKTTFSEFKRFKMLLIYLVAYLMFNDGIQTVLSIAGAFGADVLGVGLTANIMVILIIQFTAAPAAMLFSKIAEKTSTKKALVATLVGWCVVIMVAVGFAPLEPAAPEDHNYVATWSAAAGSYELSVQEGFELDEKKQSHMGWQKRWQLEEGSKADADRVDQIIKDMAETEFSLLVVGGAKVGSHVGKGHPSQLGAGTIDFWPATVRSLVWGPLGWKIDVQWLVLGLLGGFVMGGSQALARSLFGMMVPETRSTEFFGFFGFIGKAASVLGPLLFGLVAVLLDPRVGVLSILVIIVAGTVMMGWVNVSEGVRVAKEEDANNRARLEDSKTS